MINTTQCNVFWLTHLEQSQYLRRLPGMQPASTPSQPSVEGTSRLNEPWVNDKGLPSWTTTERTWNSTCAWSYDASAAEFVVFVRSPGCLNIILARVSFELSAFNAKAEQFSRNKICSTYYLYSKTYFSPWNVVQRLIIYGIQDLLNNQTPSNYWNTEQILKQMNNTGASKIGWHGVIDNFFRKCNPSRMPRQHCRKPWKANLGENLKVSVYLHRSGCI